MNRLLASVLGALVAGACSPQPEARRQEPRQETAGVPAPAPVTTAIDPRDVQIAAVGMLPGGYPQGPEQGELYTTREQTVGVPVMVMPVAPDRLDALLGREPDQVQLLIIPLVDERTPAGTAAEADVTAETLVPSPSQRIDAVGDPFRPPERILDSYPTRP